MCLHLNTNSHTLILCSFGELFFLYFKTFHNLSVKRMFHSKPKVFWKFPHPLTIQDVDEFVSSSEQIWRSLALYNLLTSGSSAVNGCRQNESPNSW